MCERGYQSFLVGIILIVQGSTWRLALIWTIVLLNSYCVCMLFEYADYVVMYVYIN